MTELTMTFTSSGEAGQAPEENSLRVQAEVKEKGRITRLTYRMAENAAEETLDIFREPAGAIRSVRRTGAGLSMSFTPGETTEGFLPSPAGSLTVRVRTERLEEKTEAGRRALTMVYRLELGGVSRGECRLTVDWK